MEELLHHFETPVTDPVLVFALVMLLLLVSPLFAKRLKLPGIVGLLVAGAVVGPNGLEILQRGQTFELLGTVGLLYIMFTAGLEIDLNQFKRYIGHSSMFGAATFAIPQLAGTLVAFYFLGIFLDISLAASLLLASMFASHTLISYPLVSKLGLTKNRAVTTAVGGTMITDVAALLVLAIVMGSHEGGLGATFWIGLVGGFGLFLLVLFWGVPRLGTWFMRHVSSEGVEQYVFILAVVFVSAFLSEVAGVEAIVGAFMAGLALNRLVPHSSPLMNRIEFVGNALFIPFFLISVGMLVDVGVLLEGPEALIVAATMVAVALLAKYAAAQLMRPLLGFESDEAMVVYGLSVAQAAATLAVVLVAYDVGIFGEAILNGTIVMIAVTCFVAPWVTEKWGRRLAEADAKSPDGDDASTQRILIPVANKKTVEDLLDLSLLIRREEFHEPLYPLKVVPEDEQALTRVAGAEKVLESAVHGGAGADVPVVPMTRMAARPADGIVRAIIEQRITDVVMGFPDSTGEGHKDVGPIAETVLAETDAQVFVCRLEAPINTVDRLVVAFAPDIERHVGFAESVRTLKLLGSEIGAQVSGLSLTGHHRRIEASYERIKPDLPGSFDHFDDEEALWAGLEERVEQNDMVILLTGRRHTPLWSSLGDRLLAHIDELSCNEVVFAFPPRPIDEPTVLNPLQGDTGRGPIIDQRE